MKRLLAVLLTCAMLFSGAYAEETPPAKKLLSDIARYTEFLECLTADEWWAFCKAEAFVNDPTWENLTIARAAMDAAMRDIRASKAPDMTLTDDDLLSLMLEGVEAENVSLWYEDIETMRQEKITNLVSLYDSLIYDVCFEPAIGNMADIVRNSRERIVLECEYACLSINYLLVQLSGKTDVMILWDQIPGVCPTLAMGGAVDFLTDAEEITKKGKAALDRLDANIDEATTILSFNDYMLYMTEEAVKANDFSAFSGKRTVLKGEGEVFPIAQWMLPTQPQNAEYTYIFEDADGELFMQTATVETGTAPKLLKIACSGVTIQDMDEYLVILENKGCKVAYEFSADEELTTLYLMATKGEGELMIIWNEAITTVYLTDPMVHLVPVEYMW